MIQELRKDVVGRMEAWANKPSQPLEGGVRLLRTLVRQILFSFPPEKESPMAQPQEPSQQTFFDQLNEQDKQTFLMHLAQAIAKTGNVALTPEQTKFVTDVAIAITIERVLGDFAFDQLAQKGAGYAKKLSEIHDDLTLDVLKTFVELEMTTSGDRYREWLSDIHKILRQNTLHPPQPPVLDVTPLQPRIRPYKHSTGKPALYPHEKLGLKLGLVAVIGLFTYGMYKSLGD